nr:ribonuclease H-like domain-containing protein [Tanacetum cinerariifolium]
THQYDSIKITRSKTIEQKTSLLANNAELKAQIQEKVFAIVALKNDLRKLKGNIVDTKFAKTSVLEKPVLQSLRNQSVVRQPNAFKSERPPISKPRFAFQVDVNNNLSKPVTQHYLPKRRASAFAKPDLMIASGLSRNSSKNMPRFSSNDMVRNYYLEDAKKKTQEKDRNSKPSVMPSTSQQNTSNANKPKFRSNKQTSRSLHVSKSSREMSNVVPLEEVYVNQPDGFIDPYHPDQVYRLKRHYMDSNKHQECGIQIHQSPRGIFINQAKYAQKIIKKHGMTSCDSISTPMATKHLDANLSGTLVDQTKYHSMVRALMYLTASRPDIVHETCYYARYQAKPTEKHLTVVKRIFWYLKDTIDMGLWYPKDTDFELTAFSDLDHAGCLDSRKSTSGGIQFLGGDKLFSWSSKKQDCTSVSSAEVEYMSLSACCAQVLWLRT